MGLHRLPAESLEALIRKHLTRTEDEFTSALVERLGFARERGYLTRGEFKAACRWKSPRSAGHVQRNSHHRVRKATEVALLAAKDRERIEALLALQGVAVPTASAILTLLDPERYGVIDIRVWQLLHRLRLVDGARGGTGLGIQHWEQFLAVIRRYAEVLEATPREIELALFHVHREYQDGRLYREGST
jgi:hypothetical protein